MKNFAIKNHRILFYTTWFTIGIIQSCYTELMNDEAKGKNVVTSVIVAVSEGAAVGLRSGQDVVRVWCIADAVDESVFLG